MSQASQRKRRATAQKSNSNLWIIGGIVGAVVLVLALILINLSANPPGATPPAALSSGRTLGKADAPVTIDEYADFQCPICGRAEGVIRQLAPQYIDTGKAKVVYHNFAFIGDESQWASEAAECANDQGKFWEYAAYLFEHQTGENVGAFSKDNLKRFATELKLEPTGFNACLDSGKHTALIQQETAQGRALGIKATPSFLINGQFVEGLLSAQQFGAAIDSFIPKP